MRGGRNEEGGEEPLKGVVCCGVKYPLERASERGTVTLLGIGEVDDDGSDVTTCLLENETSEV